MNLIDKNSRKKFYHINSFSFKDLSKEELVKDLNDTWTVTSKGNKDLINRVCAKYTLLPKAQVVDVCNHIFASFRDVIFLGKIINFTKHFFQNKLHFYKFVDNEGNSSFKFSVKIKTPIWIKKNERRRI